MSKQQPKRTKDGTAWNIAELEKERNRLLVNNNNRERLKKVNEILNWFFWGIKSK